MDEITEDKIRVLREITKIQTTDGNWNYDHYMHGMANGLLLALAIMEDKEAKFLKKPKEWLFKKDKLDGKPKTVPEK